MAQLKSYPLPGILLDTGDDLLDFWQLRAHWRDEVVEHHQLVSSSSHRIRSHLEIQRWQKISELGRGGFGTVHLEKETHGQLRAVKEIARQHASQDVAFEYLREVLTMANLSRHSGLFIKLYGWFSRPEAIYIAMEYAPHGDLHRCALSPLSEDEVKRVTRQVAEALEVLHTKHIAHRDLKPDNVFVIARGPKWWVKLGDFGIAKRLKDNTRFRTSIDTDYTAPEILGFVGTDNESSSYTNAVDIWSLGCLVHWMLTHELPLTRKQMNAYCMGHIALPQQHLRHNSASPNTIQFLSMLLQPQSDSRPTARDILAMEWLDNLREDLTSNVHGTLNDKDDLQLHTMANPDTIVPGRQNSTGMIQDVYCASEETLINTLLPLQNQLSPKPPVTVTNLFTYDIKDSRTSLPPMPLDPSSISKWTSPVGLSGHSNTVRSVAFSPDGKTIASSSDDWTVRLWDTVTGKLLSTFSDHTGSVLTVAFSWDGSLLASGSWDRTVRLWSTSSRKHLYTFSGHDSHVLMVVSSPRPNSMASSRRFIVSASGDKMIVLWSLVTMTKLCTLSTHSGAVHAIAFSPDGTFIASGADDRIIQICTTDYGKNVCNLSGHRGPIQMIVFSPNRKLMASSSLDRTIRLWDMSTLGIVSELSCPRSVIQAIAFSPNSTQIAGISSDGAIWLWDVETGIGTAFCILSNSSSVPRTFAFSPGGKYIAFASEGKTILLWDVKENTKMLSIGKFSKCVSVFDMPSFSNKLQSDD